MIRGKHILDVPKVLGGRVDRVCEGFEGLGLLWGFSIKTSSVSRVFKDCAYSCIFHMLIHASLESGAA